MKLQARMCQACGKPDIARAGGCLSFRYQTTKGWERGYFHPACFRSFLKKK